MTLLNYAVPEDARKVASLARRLNSLLAMDGIGAQLAELPSKHLEDFHAELASIFLKLDNSISNPDLDDLCGRSGGPISVLNQRLAQAFGGVDAMYVEDGSSGANERMMAALKRVMPLHRRTVAADRLGHRSIIWALAQNNLDAVFLARDYDSVADLSLPIGPDQVDRALKINPSIGAIYLTIPSYEGIAANVTDIAVICQRHSVYFVVDAAWAPTWGPLCACGFPSSPVMSGADGQVVSLHKKGLGPSQAAAAVFRNEVLAEAFRKVSEYGAATTSPNFGQAGITEIMLCQLIGPSGQAAWTNAVNRANKLKLALSMIPGCRIIEAEGLGDEYVGDPTHVLINVSKTGVNGITLLNHLANQPTWPAIDIEMATPTTALLLIGPSEELAAELVAEHLRHAIANLPRTLESKQQVTMPDLSASLVIRIHDAVFGPQIRVPFLNSAGRIAADSVGAYPPGQSIILPGMRITKEVIDFIVSVAEVGGRIKGLSNPIADAAIAVVVE